MKTHTRKTISNHIFFVILITYKDLWKIISNLQEIDTEQSIKNLKHIENELCPISVLLSNEIMNLGKGKSLAECLKNEFRMGRYQFRDYNFVEGVTALLKDNGRKPVWKPAKLERLFS